jgi:hypothetical protein
MADMSGKPGIKDLYKGIISTYLFCKDILDLTTCKAI